MNILGLNSIRTERGSAIIEFALIVPVMALCLAGIVNFALYIQAQMQLQDQAALAAEFGATPGNQNNISGMESWATYAQDSTSFAVSSYQVTATNVFTCSPGGSTVSYDTICAGNSAGTPIEYVQVQTQGVFKNVMAFPGIPSQVTLTAKALYRVTWCNPSASSCT
jgi:Flp pilus assembly protein TadG